MKRLSATEVGGLVLAAFLFFGGLDSLIWPQSGIVLHLTNDALGLSYRSDLDVISKTGARVYGILAMLFGVGIGALALYHEKE
jgi:hypothetical protein